jgi:hypothetical protein
MAEVRGAVEAELARWRADPGRRTAADELEREWDRRALAESANRFTALDRARIALLASRNGLDASDQIALGKAIMLATATAVRANRRTNGAQQLHPCRPYAGSSSSSDFGSK